MNKNTLKEVVVEQQNTLAQPTKLVPRSALVAVLKYAPLPHTVIIAGVRRAGKSILLQQVMPHLPHGYYYFNFEDERLVNFTVADFNALYEVLAELYGPKQVFFFDEIQNITGWERFVRRMQDQGNKFFITGSNATLLSRELGTKLTGRYVSIELYPFSFVEYAAFHEAAVTPPDMQTTAQRARLKQLFNHYFIDGGMPEYLQYKTAETLSKVYESILYRDIITRYDLTDERPMRELGLYLFSNVGSLISYANLTNTLGLGSVNTVKSYLRYLENSFLFFGIKEYTASVKKQIASPPKIFCVDNALARIAGFSFSENRGHFLENIIFLELKRRGGDIFYYRTRAGGEVDFIVRRPGQPMQALQVAWSLSGGTRQRELAALADGLDELGLAHGLILTDNEAETIQIGNKTILIQPAFRWLLDNSERNDHIL